MNRHYRFAAAAAALLLGIYAGSAVSDPKHGGILKMEHRDSPASASILEEATFSTVVPFMGIFNNLVMYKQDVAQNSMDWTRSRPRHQLDLEPGPHQARLQAAPRRQMA